MNKQIFKYVALNLFLSFNILLFSSGCNSDKKKLTHNDSMQSSSKHIVKTNLQGGIASLNPHTGLDVMCRSLQRALFESLTRIGPDGNAQLAAAESVSISSDKKIYTFTLKPMLWSNGEKLTAFDFEKTWKSAVAPVSKCLRSDLFYTISNAEKAKKGLVSLDNVGIRALDEVTFEVSLEHPSPYFLDLIANPLFAALYNIEEETPTVFNGPFKVGKWKQEEILVLEKNAHYWDEQQVQLDEIHVLLVHDPSTALLMYEKGEIDYLGSPFTLLPVDALQDLSEKNVLEEKSAAAVFWMSCNTESFPLNNAKIRKALSYAVNRKEIALHVMQGEIPSNTFLPPCFSLNENVLPTESNRVVACKLFEEGLAELHLTKEEFPKLKLSHSDITGQKKVAEAVQNQWETVLGIHVELVASDWNTFFSNLAQRNFQVGGCFWYSIFNDPIYFLEFFRDKSYRYNSAQWENPHYTKLLDLANQELDPRIRREHLKQAELLLLDEMPIIPLYVLNQKILKQDWLKDVFISELGHADFKWTHIAQPGGAI